MLCSLECPRTPCAILAVLGSKMSSPLFPSVEFVTVHIGQIVVRTGMNTLLGRGKPTAPREIRTHPTPDVTEVARRQGTQR